MATPPASNQKSYTTPNPPWAHPSAFHQPCKPDPEIQAILNRKPGREYASQRSGGGGGKLTYMEGWRYTKLANEVFGYNGWSSEVRSLDIDFLDFNESNLRFSVGVSAIVRITLRDGTYHEDVGYGSMDNCKSKCDAVDKCRKEAVTDGMKRAFRLFGELLGNAFYDKNFSNWLLNQTNPKFGYRGDQLHHDPDIKIGPSTAAPKAATASSTTALQKAGTASSAKAPGAAPISVNKPPAQLVKPQPAAPVLAAQTMARPAQVVPKPEQSTAKPLPEPINRPETADLFDGTDDSALAEMSLDEFMFEAAFEGDSGFAEGGLPLDNDAVQVDGVKAECVTAVSEPQSRNQPAQAPPPKPVRTAAEQDALDRQVQEKREAALQRKQNAAAPQSRAMHAPNPAQAHPGAATRSPSVGAVSSGGHQHPGAGERRGGVLGAITNSSARARPLSRAQTVGTMPASRPPYQARPPAQGLNSARDHLYHQGALYVATNGLHAAADTASNGFASARNIKRVAEDTSTAPALGLLDGRQPIPPTYTSAVKKAKVGP